MIKNLLLFFSLFVILMNQNYASGKISGKITDKITGENLIGANVIILGTSFGAASNLEGKYLITNIPAGNYIVKVTYIGYEPQQYNVEIKDNQHLVLNFQLTVVSVATQEIVITAQASGQNAAINKQISSDNITNVVSKARIQSLPDANAAESIGRLPGISLVRSGGQATQVVIRGLRPQYNSITIEGVPIPANDAGMISAQGAYATPTISSAASRAVDLSMISSYSLENIEVFKTISPDMDASVLGGTINFGLREAKSTPSGAPVFFILAQGAYNDLMSTYNDYKFVISAEKRFFNDRFGVFLQGIIHKQNLTSNQLSVSYYQPNKQDKPDSIVLGSMTLGFSPREQKRYDATLTLDYKYSSGKLSLINFYSRGSTLTETHDETYNLANYGNDILFGTQLSKNEQNVITNIFAYEQNIGPIKTNIKISNAYSDNRIPDAWRVAFDQLSAGTNKIPNNLSPMQIASRAKELIKLENMFWQGNSSWNSFNKQNNLRGSIDIETNFNISDLISMSFKAGGQYEYTTRYYNFDNGFGSLFTGAAAGFRYNLVQTLAWLTQAPYNLDPTGNRYFNIGGFYDNNMSFGKFLKGEYEIHSSVNKDIIASIMNTIKSLGAATTQPQAVPSYVPDVYSSIANDYSGNEFRSAEYIMATINIGSQITIIPGIRYQGLKTSYTAAHFIGNADAPNPYPNDLPHKMVTENQYHGYWLPNIRMKYKPFSWLSIRAAYTTSLAYPDYNQIIPRMDVASNSGHWVVWNNYALKPAYSQNYDFQVAIYNNSLGLFAISPFLKQIDNLIFSQSTYITDPSKYPGLPSFTKTFSLTTFINNPHRVNVWGLETEWQTHFWYLPYPFNGLVLNVNYTHIFSQAKYPYTITTHSPVYPFPTIYIDSTYTDRLIQQPNDIVNLSIGYDYKQFSILLSMIYQAEIYNGTHFYNSLRSDKDKYLRWDLSIKQGLPWYNLELFFNLYNLNSEEDIYTVRGSGFPISISHYGLTAELGARFRLE